MRRSLFSSLCSMSFAALLLTCTLMLSGCDFAKMFSDSISHSLAVSASLKKSTGLDSSVSFFATNNGLVHVTVTFASLPEKMSLQQLYDFAHADIVREFKQEPKEIVIGFVIQ